MADETKTIYSIVIHFVGNDSTDLTYDDKETRDNNFNLIADNLAQDSNLSILLGDDTIIVFNNVTYVERVDTPKVTEEEE